MHLLSMVEDGGFKAMISTFHPNYELPSRTFFTKQLHKKYDDIKGEMKKALQETDSMSLTTGIWTNRALYGSDVPLCEELENGVPLPENDAPERETHSCKYSQSLLLNFVLLQCLVRVFLLTPGGISFNRRYSVRRW